MRRRKRVYEEEDWLKSGDGEECLVEGFVR